MNIMYNKKFVKFQEICKKTDGLFARIVSNVSAMNALQLSTT